MGCQCNDCTKCPYEYCVEEEKEHISYRADQKQNYEARYLDMEETIKRLTPKYTGNLEDYKVPANPETLSCVSGG